MKTNTKVIMVAGAVSLLCLAIMVMVPISAHAAAPMCYQNASKSCVSNIVYWHDSCGNIQSVAQNCNNTNQLCQNGSCVNKPVTYTASPTTTSTTQTNYPTTDSYIQNYRTNCSNGNIRWFDSLGSIQGTYQSCQDANSCTLDSCMDNACKTQLKCDGSTCAVNSLDYMTYCQNNVQGVATTSNTTTTNSGQNTTVQSGQNQNNTIVISLFGKKESGSAWLKSETIATNEKMEFLMVVKNTTPFPVNNVLAGADLTGAINYTGNLTTDGAVSAGNIVSGIDLGTVSGNTSKSIYFTATAQGTANQTIQVVARATAGAITDSDIFTANITTGVAGAVTAAVSDSPFMQFVKRWYLWIIIVVVLIALFVIIFRRLSINP